MPLRITHYTCPFLFLTSCNAITHYTLHVSIHMEKCVQFLPIFYDFPQVKKFCCQMWQIVSLSIKWRHRGGDIILWRHHTWQVIDLMMTSLWPGFSPGKCDVTWVLTQEHSNSTQVLFCCAKMTSICSTSKCRRLLYPSELAVMLAAQLWTRLLVSHTSLMSDVTLVLLLVFASCTGLIWVRLVAVCFLLRRAGSSRKLLADFSDLRVKFW